MAAVLCFSFGLRLLRLLGNAIVADLFRQSLPFLSKSEPSRFVLVLFGLRRSGQTFFRPSAVLMGSGLGHFLTVLRYSYLPVNKTLTGVQCSHAASYLAFAAGCGWWTGACRGSMFRAHKVRRIAANMMLTKMPNKKTPRMYRSGSALIWFRRANIEVLRYKSSGPSDLT